MTLSEARVYQRANPTTTIYRMPAWPQLVWSVTTRTPKELPDGAIVDAVAPASPAPAEPEQKGLFS